MSSHSNHGMDRNCSGNHFSIEGLAKMLAYGDWVRAQASRTNSAPSEILQADVRKYPYDRKQDQEVRHRAGSFPVTWNRDLIIFHHFWS